MAISLILDTPNQIFKLASSIIRDWSAKIQLEIKQHDPNLCLPPFTIVMATNQHQNHAKTNPNLTIMLQGTELAPGEMFALSGQLSTFGQNENPFIPANVAQIAIANCIAITVLQYYTQHLRQNHRQSKNGVAQHKIHKLNCVDCLKYYGAFNVSAKGFGMIERKRGENLLDGGAPFYAIYPTKQGLLALGNLEPKFFNQMIVELGLSKEDQSFCLENQMNMDSWPKMRSIFANKLLEKSAVEWQQIMNPRDTCVTAVKNFQKISQHFLHPSLLKPKL